MTYAVNQWGSHPDAGNDDCHTGEDFAELYEAINAVITGSYGPEVAFIELTGGPNDLRCIVPNPAFDPAMDDNDDWKRERAMQAGMGLGIDAYNDEMGNNS